MEFQRTVVADTAHIKQVMLRHPGWAGLIGHVLDGQRGFRARSAKRCNTIISRLYERRRGDWEYALQVCDSFLDEDLQSQFWHHVNPLPDAISCDLVPKGITRQPEGTYVVADSCNKETAACHLPAFLAQNMEKLRIIQSYLGTHPHALKDQARVQRLLSSIIENPQTALGQNSCWPLGDIIIALQVPDGAAVWTLDADFEPIVRSLGLTLYSDSKM
ncbi:MAG: hypothetical protein AAF639_08180 [Chloroflexota bacterium]